MDSLWNDNEAKEFLVSELETRVLTSQLLGRNSDLVLHGGGNTSVKVQEKDLFGNPVEVLYVKGSGWDLKTIKAQGFCPCDLKRVQKLVELDTMTDSQMVLELKKSMLNPSAPSPSVETILHAVIPHKYVDHTHADAVVTVSNSKGGAERIKQIYGDDILILPYVMPGFILSKQVYEATKNIDWDKLKGIILLNHGVFTFSEDAKVAYENMIDIVSMSEDYLKNEKAWNDISTAKAVSVDTKSLAKIRKEVSLVHGAPMVVRLKQDDNSMGFVSSDSCIKASQMGPITPDHVIQTKRIPMLLDEDINRSLSDYSKNYEDYFNRNKVGDLQCLDKAPRFVHWLNKGVVCLAPNAKRVGIVSDIVDHTLKTIQWGESLGGWEALGEKDIFDLEYWELEQAKLKRGGSKPLLEGKVILVTGASSGIGKACVEESLNQGACVIALDLNPEVESTYSSSQCLGIKVDMTNKSQLVSAIETGVKYFGGIDIVMSNAGNFPPSERIEISSDENWEKSLELNLNSHFRLLRETIAYLKEGFDPHFVFMGSKNVGAPGPGVASYSVAKAGITQLARVAALELGEYGIQVNVIHPNAVFDTAIWDDETLKKRADHYGLSIDDYKRNNVLRNEVTSKEVAEMFLKLLGPGFKCTTGAQFPIDGGNERII